MINKRIFTIATITLCLSFSQSYGMSLDHSSKPPYRPGKGDPVCDSLFFMKHALNAMSFINELDIDVKLRNDLQTEVQAGLVLCQKREEAMKGDPSEQCGLLIALKDAHLTEEQKNQLYMAAANSLERQYDDVTALDIPLRKSFPKIVFGFLNLQSQALINAKPVYRKHMLKAREKFVNSGCDATPE
jgi:hypothetical protein